jgi:hypothetical protein
MVFCLGVAVAEGLALPGHGESDGHPSLMPRWERTTSLRMATEESASVEKLSEPFRCQRLAAAVSLMILAQVPEIQLLFEGFLVQYQDSGCVVFHRGLLGASVQHAAEPWQLILALQALVPSFDHDIRRASDRDRQINAVLRGNDSSYRSPRVAGWHMDTKLTKRALVCNSSCCSVCKASEMFQPL